MPIRKAVNVLDITYNLDDLGLQSMRYTCVEFTILTKRLKSAIRNQLNYRMSYHIDVSVPSIARRIIW